MSVNEAPEFSARPRPLQPNESVRNQWSRQNAILGVARQVEAYNRTADDGNRISWSPDADDLPRAPEPPCENRPISKPTLVVSVGIVGAGAAGLFTACVFWYLNSVLYKRALVDAGEGEVPDDDVPFSDLQNRCHPKQSVHFRCEILEANSAERIGGRLFTYNFGGVRDTHDYYDVGAMRFSDNPVMTR